MRRPWPAHGTSAGETVRDIARRCKGFSGSDMVQLAEAAAYWAMREHECIPGPCAAAVRQN